VKRWIRLESALCGATSAEITNRPRPNPLLQEPSRSHVVSAALAVQMPPALKSRVGNTRGTRSSWISGLVSVDATLCHACNAQIQVQFGGYTGLMGNLPELLHKCARIPWRGNKSLVHWLTMIIPIFLYLSIFSPPSALQPYIL
jgi:hypothetical protein